nr:MAG TPA: Dephospho-CoA kinase [Caudoviricetes sp.]
MILIPSGSGRTRTYEAIKTIGLQPIALATMRHFH